MKFLTRHNINYINLLINNDDKIKLLKTGKRNNYEEVKI